ncbi:unnamed protein product [Parnassius apollo]|uniref:(apollo) hypothetical protein n=1 Tax=Parnassius apollo TaxID=110799 RepID=A0A8S3XW99_PARAO|nr:unnamed protein product [Parnassius apollo]
MPVTRSQKDAPSRPGSRPSDKDVTGEMSGSASASASSGTATRSDSSGTTTTEDTTTTETTVATATTAVSEENGQNDEAAQKETTKKTPEDIPDKGGHGSATTLKPKGSVVAPARIRLELAQYEEEDSVDEDQEDRIAQMQNWIETSVMEENNMGKHEQRGQHPPEEPNVKPEENSSTKDTSEIQALTIALKEALATRGGPCHRRTTEEGEFSDSIPLKQTNMEPSRPQKRRAGSEDLIEKRLILQGKKTLRKKIQESQQKILVLLSNWTLPRRLPEVPEDVSTKSMGNSKEKSRLLQMSSGETSKGELQETTM